MRSYKKGLAVLLLVLFAFMGFVYFAEERGHHYMLGSGTELDPYQVATEADLYAVRNDLDAYYLQTADIVMNYYTNWEPIGNADTPFQGEYDGGGHSISHLVIYRPEEDYVGLFGKAYKAVVPCELKNINMINANVTGRVYVGALAGMSFAKLTTLRSSGLVTCTENGAGGLIGYQNELSNNPEGHLSDVIDCYSTADVVGTLCSDVYPYASSKLGGLFGRIASWVVSESFATGNVSAVTTTGDAYDIGAFAGAINNIYADKWQTVTNCFASGNVTGSTASSGFAGYTYRVHYVNCYSCGQVDADGENVGAFIGRVPNGVPVPTIESCYYDSETTGQSDLYATGKTTAEMKTQETFIGWDFADTWEINGGYPTLIGPFLFICAQPTIIGPQQINCSKPLMVLQMHRPENPSLLHNTHAKISVYADATGETLISVVDSSVNPELFEYSLDNALGWTAFPFTGLDVSQQEARVRARVDCGPRLQVWMRASVGTNA